MADVYAFEHCPLRDLSHRVADRSAAVRGLAGLLWPAARRAERVEVSDAGIEAWTLAGRTRLSFDEVAVVRTARSITGGQTLQIRGSAGRIAIAPTLPGYAEIERRVRAATGSPA